MDLSKTLEELRREMNKTRRNLLNRLLENKDITVKILTGKEVFDDFARFHDETVKFKGYVDKPTKLLMKELEEQQSRGMCYMMPTMKVNTSQYGKIQCMVRICISTRQEHQQILD